ncbi:hypothetical protein GC177_10065 [bacterium]|nr:hypothetical protein [bacterium]
MTLIDEKKARLREYFSHSVVESLHNLGLPPEFREAQPSSLADIWAARLDEWLRGASDQGTLDEMLHLLTETVPDFIDDMKVEHRAVDWLLDSTEGAVALMGPYALKFSYGAGSVGFFKTKALELLDRPPIAPVVQSYGAFYFSHRGLRLTDAQEMPSHQKQGALRVEIMPNLNWPSWYQTQQPGQPQVELVGIYSPALRTSLPDNYDSSNLHGTDIIEAYGIHSRDATHIGNHAIFRVDGRLVELVLDAGGAEPLLRTEEIRQQAQSAPFRQYLEDIRVIQESVFGFGGLNYDPLNFHCREEGRDGTIPCPVISLADKEQERGLDFWPPLK